MQELKLQGEYQNLIYSGRGGAELRKNLLQVNLAVISTKVQHIDWNFNAQYGRNFGGVFEVMTTSAKQAIKGILGGAEITDKELHIAMCGAEQLLNLRPIT